MSNEQTDESKEFHTLAEEVRMGYSELFADKTSTPADVKAKKKALKLKEQELKRRLKAAKK